MAFGNRIGGRTSLTVIALLGLAGWAIWNAASAPAPAPSGSIRVSAPEAAAIPPPHTTVPSRRATAPTLDWLLGTWSLRDNKGERAAPCDLASVVTYLPGGQYYAAGRSGRYAFGGGAITTWGQIAYDIDGGEDRSHFEERTTVSVARVRDDAMQAGGVLLYRCEKTASDPSTPDGTPS